MAHIDTGDRALYDAVSEVRDESCETNWVVITYAPQRENPSGNKLKVQATGVEFDDLADEFDEGRAQFALLRVRVKEIYRFVFISWCGEGVQGMQKGRFGDHSVDMERWIAPFHVQINARCPDDIDLNKIILPRVYKALGADYDAGGAKDQSVQKDGRFNASSYNQKEDISAMQQKSAAFWSAPESKATVQGSGYNKDTSFQQSAGAASKKSTFEELAKPAPQPEIQRTGRTFQAPRAAPAPEPVKAAPAPRPYQQAKAAAPPPTNRAAPAPAPAPAAVTRAAAPAPPPVQQHHDEPEEDNWDEPAPQQQHYEEPVQEYYEEPVQQHYEEPAPEQHYDESQHYDQGGYDEGQQGGYDEHYDQGGYDEGQQHYDQGGYDESQQHYDQGGQTYIRQVTALYDYVGEGEDDLSFYAGDVINVIDDSDPSGWYRGELNGAVGVFPNNFIDEGY